MSRGRLISHVALVYEGELWNLTGLAYNNDAGSEFSLQNRGYELTSVEKISDVGTETATQYEIQTALDRLANEKMQKLKRNEKKYNISVLMNRRYSVGDFAYIETVNPILAKITSNKITDNTFFLILLTILSISD